MTDISSRTGQRVRSAAPGDAVEMCALIGELAEFERSADQVLITPADLSTALFRPNPALFGHVATGPDGELVGLALWFLNFSTWTGTHGVYLEDLYVRPPYRGQGIGTDLLRELARVCAERGYHRLEWSVLDWNTQAIGFYRSLGAGPQDDWTTFRLTGDALVRFGTDQGALGGSAQ